MGWSRVLLAVSAFCLVVSVAHAAGPVEISQPWVAPAEQGADGVLLLTLDNEGDTPDTLLRVACTTTDDAAIVANGGPATVAVPPHGELSLTMGGPHVVLRHLDQPLKAGQLLPCTATFEHAGERLMEVSVRPNAPPPPGPI